MPSGISWSAALSTCYSSFIFFSMEKHKEIKKHMMSDDGPRVSLELEGRKDTAYVRLVSKGTV
jgi:hypothetical protein